jgi:hypothetical protein
VAGVPVAGVPVAGVPVAGVPVTGVPVTGVPVTGIPVGGTSVLPRKGLLRRAAGLPPVLLTGRHSGQAGGCPLYAKCGKRLYKSR